MSLFFKPVHIHAYHWNYFTNSNVLGMYIYQIIECLKAEDKSFINTQNQRPLVLDDFQQKGFCFQIKLHVYTRSGVFYLSLIRLVYLSVRKNNEKIRMWKDRTLTHFGSTSQFQPYNHNNFLLSDLEDMDFWLITNI